MSLLQKVWQYFTPKREKCSWCGTEYEIYEVPAHIPGFGWLHQACYIPALRSLLARNDGEHQRPP